MIILKKNEIKKMGSFRFLKFYRCIYYVLKSYLNVNRSRLDKIIIIR